MKNKLNMLPALAAAIGLFPFYVTAQESTMKMEKQNKMSMDTTPMVTMKMDTTKVNIRNTGSMDSMTMAQHNMMPMEKMPKEKMMPDLSTWPEASQAAAKEMTEKYGKPQIASDEMLVWVKNGIWNRTIVFKKEVDHDFPMPHKDVVQQFVSYKVANLDKGDELVKFDGSVVVDRTQGEISARCDKEANNILALNLADDVATGKKTVAQARAAYAQNIAQEMKGEKPAYIQKLIFSSDVNTADKDMKFDMTKASMKGHEAMPAYKMKNDMPTMAESKPKMCVKMQGGKMMQMKDGKMVGLDEDLKFSNGAVVMKDGNMKMKNGKMMHLKNGDCVMMDGSMQHMTMKKTMKGKM